MNGRGTYLRVGLLIVGGAALLVGLIWFLGGARFGHGILFESYFRETVQGLEVGAPVKYRGVTLGRVTDIGLVSAEYGRNQPAGIERQTYRLVFVRYVIDPTKFGRASDIADAVRSGLRSRLASQGITGLSYIELDFVKPTEYPPQQVPWQPKAEYIPSMPSTFSQVQDALQLVLGKINRIDIDKIATEFTGLLVDLRADLSSGDVHATLAAAETMLRTTNAAVRGADLQGLTADLRRTSGSLRELAQGEQTRKLVTNAALAAQRLANAAARLPQLISAMQATIRRVDNGTADIEQGLVPLLRDAQATVANLREATDSLRRYPAGGAAGSAAATREGTGEVSRRLRRRLLLGGMLSFAGCSVLPSQPYLEKHDWPLVVRRATTLPRRAGRPVLLVRTVRAAPELEVRGLQWLLRDGSVHVDYYEEWAVQPAAAVDDDLRQWLAASGLYSAVLAPGSRLHADLVLESELPTFVADPPAGVARVALSLVLLDQRSTPAKVRLQQTIRAEPKLAGATVADMVEALRAGLRDVLEQTETALSGV